MGPKSAQWVLEDADTMLFRLGARRRIVGKQTVREQLAVVSRGFSNSLVALLAGH